MLLVHPPWTRLWTRSNWSPQALLRYAKVIKIRLRRHGQRICAGTFFRQSARHGTRMDFLHVFELPDFPVSDEYLAGASKATTLLPTWNQPWLRPNLDDMSWESWESWDVGAVERGPYHKSIQIHCRWPGCRQKVPNSWFNTYNALCSCASTIPG